MEYDFVDGPLAGQRIETSGSRVFRVPDAKDVVEYVRSDGTVGLKFGQHEYELQSCGNLGERYQWVGYFTPAGSRPAGALYHE